MQVNELKVLEICVEAGLDRVFDNVDFEPFKPEEIQVMRNAMAAAVMFEIMEVFIFDQYKIDALTEDAND